MDINLNLYKIFNCVVKNKSMTKAADELLISQPAITKAIKTLENQIGGTLLLRSNKGLELTPEGQMLYEKITVALDIISDAENSLSSFFELKTGEVKIGISTVLSKILLKDTILAFSDRYPGIKINIINGLTGKLLDDLSKGKLDFVIYNDGNPQNNGFKLEKLTSLKFSMVYNPDRYNIQGLNDLEKRGNTLILQRKGSFTRDIIDEFLDKNNIKYGQGLAYSEVVSHELVYRLAQWGQGIGFVYDELIDDDNLKKITVDDLYGDIYIVRHKTIISTKAADEFLMLLRGFVKDKKS